MENTFKIHAHQRNNDIDSSPSPVSFNRKRNRITATLLHTTLIRYILLYKLFLCVCVWHAMACHRTKCPRGQGFAMMNPGIIIHYRMHSPILIVSVWFEHCQIQEFDMLLHVTLVWSSHPHQPQGNHSIRTKEKRNKSWFTYVYIEVNNITLILKEKQNNFNKNNDKLSEVKKKAHFYDLK